MTDTTSSDRDSSCIICYEAFGADKQVCATVPCGHVFHLSCFQEWERSQRRKGSCKCPICNTLSTSSVRLFVQFSRDDDHDDGASLSSHSQGDMTEEQEASTLLQKSPSLDNKSDPMRRKAKRLKKHVQALEIQRTELLEKEKTYMAQHNKVQVRIQELESEMQQVKDLWKAAQRSLDHSNHELQRERIQRTRAHEALTLVEQHASQNEQELRTIQVNHSKQLQEAQLQSMVEVREVLQQHRELVEGNNRLKKRLNKITHQYEKEKNHQKDNIHCCLEAELEIGQLNNVKKSKEAATLWAAAKRSNMVKEERQAASLEMHTRTHVRMSNKMSGQATRMSLAAMRVTKHTTNPLSGLVVIPSRQGEKKNEIFQENSLYATSVSLVKKKRMRSAIEIVPSNNILQVSKPISTKPPSKTWGSLVRPSY